MSRSLGMTFLQMRRDDLKHVLDDAVRDVHTMDLRLKTVAKLDLMKEFDDYLQLQGLQRTLEELVDDVDMWIDGEKQ